MLGVALVFVLWTVQGGQETRALRSMERVRLTLAGNMIVQALTRLRTDTLLIASHPAIITAAEGEDNSKALEALTPLAHSRPDYRSLRFIDTHGAEKVRIDRDPGTDPRPLAPQALQNKNTRYYVRQGLAGPRDAVFISPLDLNVEHGYVVRPLQPTIRAVTPVFSTTGLRLGLIVINYDAASLLRSLRSVHAGGRSQLEITNANGYWVLHDDDRKLWGAQLPERAQWRLNRSDPTLWRPEGAGLAYQRELADGRIASTAYVAADFRSGATLRLFDNGGDHAKDAVYLRLFSQVPAARVRPETSRLIVVISAALAIMLFALVGLAYTMARDAGVVARAHQRAVQAQRKSEALAREAVAAGDARMRFLASMSHEIRTPLNGVLGMAEHVLDGPLEPSQREMIEIVRSSGSGLLSVLNDILDFSKISAGLLKTEVVATDLSRVVHECVRLMEARAIDKSIALSVEGISDPVWVLTDETRLRQILLNLVGNAVKFTEHGGVSVLVEIADHGSETIDVAIDVLDTGCGIDPSRMEAIFDPFVQAEASTARDYGGTGLGLAISRQLAQALGGKITVFSRLREGSRFNLSLSLRPAEPPAIEDVSGNDGELKGASVLLVDDDRINRLVARKFLERLGASHIEEAYDGPTAVTRAAQSEWDLILMDVQMPRMDGLQATRLIREHERTSGGSVTPIIAVTAHAMKEDERLCREAGMNGYVTKPLSALALEAALLTTTRRPSS